MTNLDKLQWYRELEADSDRNPFECAIGCHNFSIKHPDYYTVYICKNCLRSGIIKLPGTIVPCLFDKYFRIICENLSSVKLHYMYFGENRVTLYQWDDYSQEITYRGRSIYIKKGPRYALWRLPNGNLIISAKMPENWRYEKICQKIMEFSRELGVKKFLENYENFK